MSTKTFYGSAGGDNLIDSNNYPEEISLYLNAEKKLLEDIVKRFKMVIEVGCMNGRYLNWALERKKYYIGIDVVNRYISEAKNIAKSMNLDPRTYEFVCEGVEQLHTILNEIEKYDVQKEDILLFFPFNSFGNIENIEATFLSLKCSDLSLYISSYKTDKISTDIRKMYYKNCGYCGIIESHENVGIRFKSNEGMNTVAYFPDWLTKRFSQLGIKIKMHDLDKIGIAYESIL